MRHARTYTVQQRTARLAAEILKANVSIDARLLLRSGQQRVVIS
jgi:hypothetical protein